MPQVPDPPRLGIVHLLVWTACVAVVLGLNRLILRDRPIEGTEGIWLLLVGISGGTALGGLVLYYARRYRGLPFPVAPGDYLLVVHGIDFGLRLAVFPLFWMSPFRDVPSLPFIFWSGLGATCFSRVLMLWPAKRVKEPHWHRCFWTMFVGIFLFFGLIVLFVLLVALIEDYSKKRTYPWTHWVGIALEVRCVLAVLAMPFLPGFDL